MPRDESLPMALFRTIARQEAGLLGPSAGPLIRNGRCSPTEKRLHLFVAPGIGPEKGGSVLDPLRRSVENDLAGRVTVEVLPGWGTDVNIVSYASVIGERVDQARKRAPGSRLGFIANSLGGTAVLFQCAKMPSAEGADYRPFVLTLNSPILGSTRFQSAVEEWMTDTPESNPVAFPQIASQLLPDSSVMRQVQCGLSCAEAHHLADPGDPIIDAAAGYPYRGPRLVSIVTTPRPSLASHFGFPRHDAVIERVTDIAGEHAAPLPLASMVGIVAGYLGASGADELADIGLRAGLLAAIFHDGHAGHRHEATNRAAFSAMIVGFFKRMPADRRRQYSLLRSLVAPGSAPYEVGLAMLARLYAADKSWHRSNAKTQVRRLCRALGLPSDDQASEKASQILSAIERTQNHTEGLA